MTRSQSRHSRLVEPIWRSICEFALGAPIGVLITTIPSPSNTRSEPTPVLGIVIVDQEPRRHAQLVELPAHIPGLLVTQAASGLSVTANQITRLVASSIYKRT